MKKGPFWPNNIGHLLLAILFVAFGIVQWNDPDPAKWIILYLVVAVLAGFAATGRFSYPLTVLVLIATVVWALFYVPNFIRWLGEGAPSLVSKMKAESPHIEKVREFLGLLIVVIVLLYYFQVSKKRKG